MARSLGLVLLLVAATLSATGSAEDMQEPFSERYSQMGWAEIVAEAEGQRVAFHMWGGADFINAYITDFVAPAVADRYGITLELVPVTDASVFVSRVIGEQQAGRTSGGAVDLMWINGENFRTLRQADLLFGPFAEQLPNRAFVDGTAPSIQNDFGFPVDGYESPYGSAQFVMIYDSAVVPEPPATIPELYAWIRENPGRFAYPASPDFTGSAFIRHLFYHAAGGYELLLGPFAEAQFNAVAPSAWDAMNDLEPFLWRQGRTYPESQTQLNSLYANGEVDFAMSYNPVEAATLVEQQRFPESTRTFVFDTGTIGNTHFVAIPFNSSAQAAAMVVANFLLSPEAQYQKARPDVWGDMTVLDLQRVPAEWQARFATLPQPPAVLSTTQLAERRIPELTAGWLAAIEGGWLDNVLEN